jgi:CubicO group peptidase (beta-lactamase class C family)
MNKPAPAFACVCLAALMAPPMQAPNAPDRYRDQLQPQIERFLKQEKVPGLAIAIVENYRVVYAQGFGEASLARPSDPVSTRTLFHVASTPKPFVATAVMQLVEKGIVDLDAPVVKYLPYFRLDDGRYRSITVRQMVTHSSGMPDVENYEWDKPQYDDGALERYVRSLSTYKLLFAPGARFSYSNMAFDLLGDLIAKASEESFEAYVRHHILAPLGMTGSTLLIRDADPRLLAAGHEMSAVGEIAVTKVAPYNRIHSPSSNLLSSANDMARWAMANMNRGALDGKRILKDSTYALMWSPAFTDVSGSNWRYARGVGISWGLGTYHDNPVVWHAGGDTGFVSDFVMLPDKGIAVVWMMNADWPRRVTLTTTALDIALRLKPR